jgi:hypothetical protein
VKVIQQLITYFEERGQLTPRQVQELMEKGYGGTRPESDLRSLEKNIGESYYVEVTGEDQGPLWGTDVYTSDSSLGTACVHAGLLARGEFGLVRVTIVPPLAVFQGSTRHGVTSEDWTNGHPGAFRVELVASDRGPLDRTAIV